MKIKILFLTLSIIMMVLGSCSKKSTESEIIEIGDIISFGVYSWLVLDIQNDRALIVSENLLERGIYNTSLTNITWAESSIREYLNGEFYNSTTFSNRDRARIYQVSNINQDNQWYGTPGGEITQDKIFLLSIAEVVKYFGDSGQLDNRPEDAWRIDDIYNINRITTFNGSPTWWWLRSPGYNSLNAGNVNHEGYLNINGIGVHNDFGGVRPALWLNL